MFGLESHTELALMLLCSFLQCVCTSFRGWSIDGRCRRVVDLVFAGYPKLI